MHEKLSCKVKVKNALGLHARPATMIVKLLQSSKSAVTFVYKKESINARSIMSILMLAAAKHSQITVHVEGEDARLTMDQLVSAFDNQFGEP
jgi:phosphocarrier protein HPr